jgi:hypothetical protein
VAPQLRLPLSLVSQDWLAIPGAPLAPASQPLSSGMASRLAPTKRSATDHPEVSFTDIELLPCQSTHRSVAQDQLCRLCGESFTRGERRGQLLVKPSKSFEHAKLPDGRTWLAPSSERLHNRCAGDHPCADTRQPCSHSDITRSPATKCLGG